MRIFILFLFLLCASCTKPLGDENPLEQPSSEAPGEFAIASIQRVELQLLVAWTSSKGAKSYELNYGTTAGTYTETITATKSPLVIQGLTPGTTYYFRMKAINSLGTTLSTAEKSYPFLGAPGEFTILTAIPGNGKVTLAWDLSPEASSYAVMSGPSADNITTTVAAKALPPFEVGSLTNGTTYHFKVVATNPIGSRDSSNTMSATPTPPPSVPLNLTTTPGSGQCTLVWEAPASGAGPIFYTVRRTTGGNPSVVACSNVPTLTCVDSSISNAVHSYTVEATNLAGTSPLSSSVSCAVGMPGDFQLLTATPGNTQVTLTWGNSPLATAYTVKYGTSPGSFTSTASTSATSPYVVSSLTNTVPYYFSVIATNAVGTKTASNSLSATPDVPPSVPLTPTVVVSEIGKCTLNWMPPATGAPPLKYTVRRVVNATTNVVICENISARTCSEEGLSSATYNYTIEAVNAVGTGPKTGNIACTLGTPGIPTSVTATAGNKKVTLSWVGGSGASSYTVKYGTTTSPTTVASTTATSPFVVENLTNGTLHYFRVESVNAYGSTPAANVSATPTSTQPNITIQGPTLTVNAAFNAVTFGDTYSRKFIIADPDAEDTIDCSGNTATSSNTGVIPNSNITLGGSGLNCSIAIASTPGVYGQTGISLSATDGQAIRTLSVTLQALPTPRRIYSWRRHGNYSGPALTVRRASDNNTTDIYFDAHGMVDPYLTTFLTSTTGYLVTWYDQGSQGKHAYQPNPTRQPIVALSGGVLRITADGTDDAMILPDFPVLSAMTVYTHFTFSTQSTAASLLSFGKKDASALEGFEIGRTSGSVWRLTSALTSSTLETTTGPALSATSPGQAMILNTAGSPKRDLITSSTSTPATVSGSLTGYVPSTNLDAYLFSGGTSGTTLPIKGYIKELLIFDQDLTGAEIKALTSQN